MVELTNSSAQLKLNTGASIPQLGLGTWRSTDEEAYHAVLEALKLGYRHIDSAAIYKNEIPVGKAIKDSGIPREELFITTKLWGTQQRDPVAALDASLKRLGLDYVDLYLVHWPFAFEQTAAEGGDPYGGLSIPEGLDEEWTFIKTWGKLQELPATGKAKAVGVSNYSVKNLKDLLESPTTKLVPAVNQVESHPLLPQNELIKFGKEHGIIIEAYSPLGSQDSPLFTDATLAAIAESYGVSVAQVLINWALNRGVVVLPKSINKTRIEANFKVFDLKEEDFDKVSALVKDGEKRFISPSWDTGSITLFE
jgi:glycerol 2-dehydrogenase (NADP+)